MPDFDPGLTDRINQRLAQTIGRRPYELWIQPSVRLRYRDQDRTLRVAVPNRFVADKVRDDFAPALRAAVRAEADLAADTDLALELTVEPDHFTSAPGSSHSAAESDQRTESSESKPSRSNAKATTPAAHHKPRPRSTTPAFRHRFEDFVVGPCNELAYAAALALAQSLGDAESDAGRGVAGAGSLFVHGECGVGKTHLLQAACRRALERRPDARVLYLTAEEFTNRYVAAVRNNTLETFRREIRRLDLLAVDDISFFANKRKTQQEFFHSVDHVELRGARVLLAGDSHPRLIKDFSDALVSRCLHGLVVQVQPPDPATRLTLVARLAQQRGLVLRGNVAEHLAAHAGRAVREIEGTIAQLHALAGLTQSHTPTRFVDRALVERLFAGQRQLTARRPVRFADVRDAVCDALNVSPDQVAGSSRQRQVVLARALVVYLAKDLTTQSYPELAAALGKSSHSTVVTAVQRMTRQLEANAPLLLRGRGESTTPVQLVEELRAAVLQHVND
ncbi:MAG: DnaA/Hda family protein [Planctomycetota bacterium]